MSTNIGLFKLPKNFFDENPVQELSTAQLTYFHIVTSSIPGLNDEVEKMVVPTMEPDRLEKYEKEREQILQINQAEEAIQCMRKIKEPQNRGILLEKVLSMQDDVMPLILKRLVNSAHDVFIETATIALAYADMKYVEQLYDIFNDIRSPYAKSEASLVFGVKKRKDFAPLLLEQYRKIKQECQEMDYEQGPLLALYLMYHEKG